MARLPVVRRDQVPEQFREAFDAVTAASGGVITSGPGSITINSPEMARRRNHLTNYLQYETTFAPSPAAGAKAIGCTSKGPGSRACRARVINCR